MATFEPGQTYVPSGAAEIRDDFLTDVRLEAIAQGVDNPPVYPGSDWHVLATALANLALIQYANITIADDNGDVLNATGDDLDAIREAYGLPEVPASPSSGKVVASVTGGGSITVLDATEFVLPNGKRGKVSGLHLGVVDGDLLDVVTIDTGADTELAANEIVRFVSPPLNLETEARVSVSAPLTGGLDEEDDERKRTRILNRLQSVPAGGNVGFVIETCLNALASLQYAFVYPALGGPASMKVALLKDIDPDNSDFARALGAGATDIVRSALHGEMPSPMEIIVQSVAEESTDVAIVVSIPDASSAGGNGTGWLDDPVWPPLEGGDTEVDITNIAPGGGADIRVSASTSTSPVAGQTHIAWWSRTDQRFYVRLVTAVSGSSGAWDLTLDAPLVDSQNGGPVVGEYISPASSNQDAYGDSWRTAMRALGPGENTADSNRLPRAERHPAPSEVYPQALNLTALRNFVANHDEISDADWSSRSLSTPTVPASVATAPNVLVPRDFGVYKQ